MAAATTFDVELSDRVRQSRSYGRGFLITQFLLKSGFGLLLGLLESRSKQLASLLAPTARQCA